MAAAHHGTMAVVSETDHSAAPGSGPGDGTSPSLHAREPASTQRRRACCLVDVLFTGESSYDLRAVAVDGGFEAITGIRWDSGATLRDAAPQLAAAWVDVAGRALRSASTSVGQRLQGARRSVDVSASRVNDETRGQVFLVCSEVIGETRDGDRAVTMDRPQAQDARFRVFADTAPAMLWVTEHVLQARR
jgi:hypothetical protein